MQKPNSILNIESWIQKSMPDLYSMMILSINGDLRSYYVSEICASKLKLKKLEELAKLISIRYTIGGFDKVMGGLEFTINSFSQMNLLVKQIHDSNFLAVLIPKESSLDEKAKLFHELYRMVNKTEASGLKKTGNTPSAFEKARKKHYDELEPEKFMLVAKE